MIMGRGRMMRVDDELFYPGLKDFKKKNGLKSSREATKYLWKAILGERGKKKRIIKIKKEIEF